MAELDKTGLEARYNHATTGKFKDNTTNAITEEFMRDLVEYLCDSLSSINYRGDYAGTNAFPSTGGTLSGGVPAAGNRWRLTATLTIGGTDIYAPGTIIEAAINTPGQTTANWIKYAMQS